MTEELERLVQAVEGQGPSAEFVARLRAQVVAETEGLATKVSDQVGARTGIGSPSSINDATVSPDDDIAFVVDLEPLHSDDNELAERRTRTQRRTQLLATAAAVAVVFIGIWAVLSITNDDDRRELDTVDIPTPTTEASGPAESGQAAPLTAGNTVFDAGTYRLDTLGTAFTFSVEETTGVLVNANGVVSITDLTSNGADDRTITFRRTSLLPDPAAPTVEVDQTTGWPAADLRGWLEAASDEITAGDPVDTTLGGFGATFVELEVPCAGVGCTAGSLLQQPDRPLFTPGSRYRLVVVDQGQEDPIVVVVAIDDEDEAAWFDEADAILSSLVFESIEPNPVRRMPPGAAVLAVFDGISVDLPEAVVIVEPFDGFARIFPPNLGGDVEFLTRPLDTDGVEVTTTERFVKLLADEAAALTELEAFEIGGFEARRFNIDSGRLPNVVLKARTADLVRSEFGWESPSEGHLWVVEQPDRGLLIVSAEALDGPEAIEPLRAWTDELLRTLAFQER